MPTILDHLRSDCNTPDQIWPKKCGQMVTMGKKLADSRATVEEFAARPARLILADNFKKLCDYHFHGLGDEELAKKTGIAKGTIGRIRRGEVAATLTSLEKIAAVFRLAPYQLLIPIEDVENPLSIRNTKPNPVDSDLVDAWPFLAKETQDRFVKEALAETLEGHQVVSELMQRFKNRLR